MRNTPLPPDAFHSINSFMAYIICDITEDGQILAPVVGCFRLSSSESSVHHHYETIGRIVRLGVSYEVVVPISVSACVDVSDNTWVTFGDVLGHIQVKAALPSEKDDKQFFKIYAPTDGFVVYLDGLGTPFKKKGDRVSPGDIVATIELMKIRMDIMYDGDIERLFIGYKAVNSRAIRRGDVICLLGRCEDEGEFDHADTAVGGIKF